MSLAQKDKVREIIRTSFWALLPKPKQEEARNTKQHTQADHSGKTLRKRAKVFESRKDRECEKAKTQQRAHCFSKQAAKA